ncbi:MAG: HAD hydrolase family protein [Bacteroidetes bacterium]|jgi:3-deoxy-D-manno-octulosonate 8-phosphate phosphatase (KDO 8-P phosphatase)|nr:HAD hydrolase family protein [Bacteroidota bacterium]
MSNGLLHKLERIKHFVFDVDGVFTNSQLLLTENGDLLRSMSTRDGLSIKIALRMGYGISIITGGKSNGVRKRLSGLGVSSIYTDVEDKLTVFKDLIESENINREQVLFMGDDLPDIAPMQRAGLACCPFDAAEEIKKIADYITASGGGKGCVREIVEKVLRIQSNWNY